MDRTGADFDGVVTEIHTKLGATPVPLMLPIGREADFKGVIDVLENKCVYFDEKDNGVTMTEEEPTGDLKARQEAAYKHMVECLAEVDDEIMEIFLADEMPSHDQIKAALRRATLAAKIVPVACCTAFKNKGVQPVLDIVVDIRKGSPTFGRNVAVELSGENKRQLFAPRGMAHGFAVLSATATFAYKCDNIYAPTHERSIRFDDPKLGIDWQIPPENYLLSEKDRKGVPFDEAEYL